MAIVQETKEYYEAQSQKKVLYIMNLSDFCRNLNNQVLKLPHEMYEERLGGMIGTKYSDIEHSFINGVKLLYHALKPIRIKLGNDWVYDTKSVKDYDSSLLLLEWCYEVMDRADILNDNVITLDIDEDGEFDPDLVVKPDGKNDRPVSAPLTTADGKAVGRVEEKDKQPVV